MQPSWKGGILLKAELNWWTWSGSNRRSLPCLRPNIKYFNKLQGKIYLAHQNQTVGFPMLPWLSWLFLSCCFEGGG
jgi:hypothetical protein